MYIILLLLLLLLVMNKRYCRTIKGKRRCTKNKPRMNARDIVKLQMNALQNNNKNDKGIQVAYKYASKENKLSTGPYHKFRNMIHNEPYKHLLNNKSWKFVTGSIHKHKDEEYSVDVQVVSSYDNNSYQYTFKLSRDTKTLFWRTNSVLIKNIDPDSNKYQMNIHNKELQPCSIDPMTGWYRDGYCKTDENDIGTHTVCAKMTDEFLKFTKSKGNDLSTPRNGFPGLKEGDQWCLCANRWLNSHRNNKAPKIILESTNKLSEDYIDKTLLKKYSIV